MTDKTPSQETEAELVASSKTNRNLVIAVVASVLLSLVLNNQLNRYFSPQASNPVIPYVVLDTRLIMESATKQIMSKEGITKEQVTELSAKLGKNMKTLIDSYRDKGIIVINSAAVLTAPEELDITKSFAESLGVELIFASK